MNSKTFVLVCVALCVLFGAAPHFVPTIHVLSHGFWWPSGVVSMTLVTVLGHRWVRKASSQSPMAFVTSVNGVTAMKLLLSLFAVFVGFSIVFVASAASLSKKTDKK